MIVSVSRRTDIPAFYSDWFMDKIEKGYVEVINPFNRKQVSKIELTPKTVDCFVFWSKNPEPMLSKLDALDQKGFQYYFQFTVTSYQSDIETGVKNKNDIIRTFINLSKKIGKEKVVWRYDPILINNRYTKEYHYKWFEALCKRLSNYTNKCVISFLDMYTKTKRNTKDLKLIDISNEDMRDIAKNLSSIGSKYNIIIETCCEAIDLSLCNIQKGKCIDDKIIQQIIGTPLNVKKDETQREVCGCVKSVDIGQYNTCKHFCAYCYANYNRSLVIDNCKIHDVHSPLLVGKLVGDETITIREMKSVKCNEYGNQMELDFNKIEERI
jgi:hypothetical protein